MKLIKSNNEVSSLKIPAVNPYGQCKFGYDNIKYLKNDEINCGNLLILNDTTCSNYTNQYFDINTDSVIITNYNPQNAQINVANINYNINKINKNIYYTQGSSTLNIKSLNALFRISNTDCICTNVISRIDIKFYMSNDTINQVEQHIYVDDITDTCGTKKYINTAYRIEYVGQNKVMIINNNIFYRVRV
jgi:hypothetical protein